jgi:uncharacterized OB-fold protein
VSGGVPVWRCFACGHVVFPARLLCPRCGAAEWESREVEEGVVDGATVVRRAPGGSSPVPVPLGTVRLEGGVVVVARLEAEIEEGRSVRLEYRDGVPVARTKEP